MSSDPSGEPRQWNGMVHVSSVFCGGVLGYTAAKALLIKPLADAASATGKALPWELMVQCAAIGSIAGALFFSVLMVTNEKLREWQRVNRHRKQREQDFSRLFEEKNQ
jgi:hypothetical protein